MTEFLTLTLSNNEGSINIFPDKIISFYTYGTKDVTLIKCVDDYSFYVKETPDEIKVALRCNFYSAKGSLNVGEST